CRADDCSGVYASAEQEPRSIGDVHSLRNGTQQEPLQFSRPVLLAARGEHVGCWLYVRAFFDHPSVAESKVLTMPNLSDARDERPRRGNIRRGEVIIDRLHVGLNAKIIQTSKPANVRSEQECRAVDGVVQRFAPYSVSRQYQQRVRLVPEGNRKVAVELWN